MSTRPMKRLADSYTTQVQLITATDLNGYGRLFGGRLMSWMDIVAGVTARRHSGMNVTTACVSKLDFHAPAHANDMLVLNGEVVYVGRSSMEIRVSAFVESLGGARKLINEARFTMVALDENEHPAEVPGLILETAGQRELWDAAEAARKTQEKRS